MNDQPFRVYVGTYTQGDSQGIYRFDLDPSTGRLTPAGAGPNSRTPRSWPSTRAASSSTRSTSSGNFDGKKRGGVGAFAIDPATGGLKLLNQQSSVGSGPCHLTVDRTGKDVLVANYGSGSVACLPIQADGRLARPPRSSSTRATAPTPAAGEPARAFDQPRRGQPLRLRGRPRARQGPRLQVRRRQGLAHAQRPAVRHVAGPAPARATSPSTPTASFAYVINEMANTVTALTTTPRTATLSRVQTISTLPEGFKGKNSTAEVQVHPSGKFLYGSNRGHDSIAIFTDRSEHRQAHRRRPPADRGQDAAQLRHRPDRDLPAGRQPGQREHRCVPH